MLSICFVVLSIISAIQADNCQYNTTDGVLDLRVFGKEGAPKYASIPDADTSSSRIYSFNGCFSYSTDGGCQNAAACVTDKNTKVSTTIARQDGREFSYASGLAQIVYTGDSGNSLRVFLSCHTPESIKVGNTGPNAYYLFIESHCACPGKCRYNEGNGGLSGGAVFVILLLSLLGAYLLFGGAFLYFGKHQRGLNVIPHRTFWIQVGSDSIGGTRFLWRKVTGKSNDYASV